MTEADGVRRIIASLQRHLPTAVTFKINDRITAGIPDLVVTYAGQTVWFEVKTIKSWHEPVGSLRKKFNALQLTTMRRLAQQGTAYYLVFRGATLDIVTPTWVAYLLGDTAGVSADALLFQCFFSTTLAAMAQLVCPRSR